MKRAASLSGSLLARKGAAQPSMGHRSPAHMLPGEPEVAVEAAALEELKPLPSPLFRDNGAAPDEAARKSERDTHGSASGAGAALPPETFDSPESASVLHAKAAIGAGKRIAMTVRLGHDDHLQLKLLSAHSRMSAQEIFSRALQEFVNQHGTELGLPESQG